MSSYAKTSENVSSTVIGSRANGGISLPTQQDKDQAEKEAQECLEAVVHEGFQLDGFNLLGVVANPRSGMIGSATVHTAAPSEGPTSQPSTPNRQSPQQSPISLEGPPSESAAAAVAAAAAAAVSEEGDSWLFSDAVHTIEHTIEYTLAQVTEQIETLNLFLEELSRQYLGDDTGESLFLEYYYQDEEDDMLNPETQNIPPQLANLQLHDLQDYLEECGLLAHSLFTQGLTTRTLDQDIVSKEELEQQLSEIPEEFYDPNFDLTNPETFVELLLQQSQPGELSNNPEGEHIMSSLSKSKTKESKKETPNALYVAAQELVPVREPDSLAGHLDRVELALQDQVRQKSSAFFQETTRFRQLQSSIEELLQQVQSLRGYMQQALSVYRQTKDISNHRRQDYERLIDLVDSAMELVQCKASIGGLLSANDHLGAAQQIQYGRKLLEGVFHATNEIQDTDSGSNTNNLNGDVQEGIGAVTTLKLQQLKSLSTCGDQFRQYESLVVQNLSEELVEIFFNWRPSDREHVQELVGALQLCQALEKAAELYQRRLQQTIRMTVRTTIAEFVESSGSGGSGGVTSMSYDAFYNCLQLLIEEIQSILRMGFRVDEFCVAEKFFSSYSEEEKRWTKDAVAQGADLAAKSIAELLRLRKESHALISQSEMKQLWDACLAFTVTMEGYGNDTRAVGLRSTLAGQAKAWLDRTHESNMSLLVAALDSERWSQCEVSAERQTSLTRLCTGLTTVTAHVRNVHENGTDENAITTSEKKPCAEVEGVQYKVVWSCLLLVEMVMTNLSSAAHFHSLAPNAVTKVVELLRLWNARTISLVLGAGAIQSSARLKSINAKHLSYVTQCLGMLMALLPHIRASLMAQLSAKQHTLLSEIDNIKKEYQDHNDKVLNKFVSIIGGIVEQGLAPRIANTDFEARDKDLPFDKMEDIKCCVFLEGISNSTRKLHQVLNSLLPPDHLQDVFSRIFAHLDEKIPALFITAATSQANGTPTFSFPTTDEGKRRLVLEVLQTTITLNSLSGVHPWDFTAMTVLERKMDYKLPDVKELKELQALRSNEEISAPKIAAENDTSDTGTETATPPMIDQPGRIEADLGTSDSPPFHDELSSVLENESQKENGTLRSKEEKVDEPASSEVQ
ncbi:Vps54 vacuolar sorting complex protein [Nitzschia inconspicua]|uniref:Vps54 vacuolar sorting complex protein n=1 Tax=Nitzschia inconspicua TaxID=303405 RepID=A0A9K3PMR2_9STRA|nr:Vps54 vacuolar sorting complex protein [Nitzschia inconspicua]